MARRLERAKLCHVPDAALIASTERLLIRPWRPEDADRVFDIHRRSEVARWLGGRPMTDRREAVALIDRYANQVANDPRFGAWAIVERSAATPAGSVLLKPLPNGEGEIEIGWHLHPDSWGRGLATEAARAIRDRGFGYGLTEIWAVTHLDNQRSARVCEKLGMQLLGITHRWYKTPSLMFWLGANADQKPSLRPDEPAPVS
jgi:RimJ/RimL family protein N-acetyltransferase